MTHFLLNESEREPASPTSLFHAKCALRPRQGNALASVSTLCYERCHFVFGISVITLVLSFCFFQPFAYFTHQVRSILLFKNL